MNQKLKEKLREGYRLGYFDKIIKYLLVAAGVLSAFFVASTLITTSVLIIIYTTLFQ